MVTDENEIYFVEEIESVDVPEYELAEFRPAEVVSYTDNATKSPHRQELSSDNEGALIKRFVSKDSGGGQLPDLFTKLEPDDEEEELERLGIDDGNNNAETIDEDLPATSEISSSILCTNKTKTAPVPNQQNTNVTIEVNSKRPRYIRKQTVLSPALVGLMGQANLSYARGQVPMAEKICLEIIRQNPLASEPFLTLAEIYEAKDKEKFLNFLTIAAHLNPHDRDQWIRIADLHVQEGNFAGARIYYSKAIKVLYKDYDLRLRRGRLLERMGEKHAAMCNYLKMIPLMPLECSELCLETAKIVAKYFHNLSKFKLSLEAIGNAYYVCGHIFSAEDLNQYMEILIINKEYTKVLQCLCDHSNLELETENEDNLATILFCSIPDDLIIDFRAKLCVCLINLHAHHLLGYLIQNIHEHIPIVLERLDSYIDIAEALMQEHKYAEAIRLLRPITDGDRLDCPAFVWLRQAECLRNLNRTNEAIESYQRVVDMAPFCYKAKFTLSALLKQQGRHIEAVKALEQTVDTEGEPLHARLLYERCVMLKQINEIDEFLEVGYTLLSRHSMKLRNREEMLAAASGGSFYNPDGLKVILQMRNITDDTEKHLQEFNKSHTENSDLTIQDEYHLFIDILHTAFAYQKFSFIQRICFAMVTTKRFVSFHFELERIIILACYFNNDCGIAFSYLRELISKTPTNMSLWNFLSLMIQKGQDLRYHRFIRRLLQRLSHKKEVRIFLAHHYFHCSSYKYALNEFVPLFKEQQLPLIALCISVIFNQISLQKKVLRKSAAVTQAIAFIEKYAELRADIEHTDTDCSAAQQEIYYNIARIYHQCGLLHLALNYYERALAVSHSLIEEHENYLGLKQEIAYNMHLIYKASGNFKKARYCLYKHCIV